MGEKDILAASFLVHQSLRVTSLDGYWHALHWQGASALVTSGELCRLCNTESKQFIIRLLTLNKKEGEM